MLSNEDEFRSEVLSNSVAKTCVVVAVWELPSELFALKSSNELSEAPLAFA